MTKTTKKPFSLSLLLTAAFLLIAMYVYCIPVKAATTPAAPKYYFLNVATGGGQKGSATLIEFRSKYYLVDGGPGNLYKGTRDKIKAIVGGTQKITIEAAIVTHNHSDHIGGIIEMVKDTSTFTVKQVYRPKTTGTSVSQNYINELDSACKKVGTAIKPLSIQSMEPLNLGYGVGVRIFGPTLTFNQWKSKYANLNESASRIENNLSMVVKVYTSDYNNNLIILGDLHYEGLKRAIETYSLGSDPICKSLFLGDVKYCVFGHHGARTSSKNIAVELDLYKTYLKADKYIMTCQKTNIAWAENYQKIVNGLGANKILNVTAGKWIVNSTVK